MYTCPTVFRYETLQGVYGSLGNGGQSKFELGSTIFLGGFKKTIEGAEKKGWQWFRYRGDYCHANTFNDELILTFVLNFSLHM